MRRSVAPGFQIWPAEPHTVAKIAILKGYLDAWLPILGRTQRGQDLVYVDGFAGPGHYANGEQGSPVAALVAAKTAVTSASGAWLAGKIRFVFVEANQATSRHLSQHLESIPKDPRLEILILPVSFVEGISRLRTLMPDAFSGRQPLLVFADPFGAKDVPFDTIRDILGSPKSEVLINFDADGFARILAAGEAAHHQSLLLNAFGDDSWLPLLQVSGLFRDWIVGLVELYKAHLKALPGVGYVYSFEMRTSAKSVGQVGYFLIFASQHRLGLERMKEAMRRVDQTGEFQFSNARVGRPVLFRFDDPKHFGRLLRDHFSGRGPTTYLDVHDFALLETPFSIPRSMLRELEKDGALNVVSTDPKRRRGTFNKEKIQSIEFVGGSTRG